MQLYIEIAARMIIPAATQLRINQRTTNLFLNLLHLDSLYNI
jgi:hypothetical protein